MCLKHIGSIKTGHQGHTQNKHRQKVCVYVHVCVCLCVCMYVFVCKLCVSASLSLCMCLCACICVCVCVSSVSVCLGLCVWVYVYVSVFHIKMLEFLISKDSVRHNLFNFQVTKLFINLINKYLSSYIIRYLRSFGENKMSKTFSLTLQSNSHKLLGDINHI